MTAQMWLAFVMCVSGHVLLHFKSDRLSRFAGAWIITGAFVLASGVAIPCWIECNVLRMEFSRAQAAEPGKRMSSQTAEPAWTLTTADGNRLEINKPSEVQAINAWHAKRN